MHRYEVCIEDKAILILAFHESVNFKYSREMTKERDWNEWNGKIDLLSYGRQARIKNKSLTKLRRALEIKIKQKTQLILPFSKMDTIQNLELNDLIVSCELTNCMMLNNKILIIINNSNWQRDKIILRVLPISFKTYYSLSRLIIIVYCMTYN